MQTVRRSRAVLYNDVLRRSEMSELHTIPMTQLLTQRKTKISGEHPSVYDSLESANKQSENGKNNNLCWNVNRTRVRDVKRPWRQIIRRPTTMLKSIKLLLLVTHWIKMRAHTHRAQKRKPNYDCSHISVWAGCILRASEYVVYWSADCECFYLVCLSISHYSLNFLAYCKIHTLREKRKNENRKDNGFRKCMKKKAKQKNGTRTRVMRSMTKSYNANI